MQPVRPTISREILRITRPWVLLASVLLYGLGGGIDHYLGGSIRVDIYLVGQAALLLLLLSGYFLRELYGLPLVSAYERSRPAPTLSRNQLLVVAASCLTGGAVLTVLLVASGGLKPAAFIFLGLAFLLMMAYAMPPLRLVDSGYGELVFAIWMADLVPAFGFLLQSGEYHRLLALMTYPLTFLYLAAYLAMQMERYAEDERFERRTMLVRLGWQRGMNLHNLLVLLGFLTLGSGTLVGLPWLLAWPGLLGLLSGVFQIYQMLAIANGAKPNWGLLRISAAATFTLTAYLMAFALWTG